jgi:hypothetical protein
MIIIKHFLGIGISNINIKRNTPLKNKQSILVLYPHSKNERSFGVG